MKYESRCEWNVLLRNFGWISISTKSKWMKSWNEQGATYGKRILIDIFYAILDDFPPKNGKSCLNRKSPPFIIQKRIIHYFTDMPIWSSQTWFSMYVPKMCFFFANMKPMNQVRSKLRKLPNKTKTFRPFWSIQFRIKWNRKTPCFSGSLQYETTCPDELNTGNATQKQESDHSMNGSFISNWLIELRKGGEASGKITYMWMSILLLL